MIPIKLHQNITGRDFVQKIAQVYFFILIVPIAIFLTGYLRNHQSNISNTPLLQDTEHLFIHIVYICLTLTPATIAYLYLKKWLIPAWSQKTLRQRLEAYIPIYLKYLGLLTLSFLLSSIGYFFTSEGLYLIITSLMLILTSLDMPNVHRISKHLRLPSHMREIFITNKVIENE